MTSRGSGVFFFIFMVLNLGLAAPIPKVCSKSSERRVLTSRDAQYLAISFLSFPLGDCSSFYQALPNSPEQESPLQESPSAPTSTAVLRDWASPAKPSPKPRKQEAPRAGWILGETSGHHVTGEVPAGLLGRGGWD